MSDDLQEYFRQLPDKMQKQIASEFADVVDEEFVEPIRAEAREGKTGRLKESVRKEATDDPLTFIVAAGGELTTKEIGTRTYRREIDISSGDTQGVPRGNASVVYDYALAEEFGNSHSSGHSFFWPTIRAHMARFRERCADIVGEVLDQS